MSEKPTLSRAEEIRRRRAREQAKREKQASERAYRPLPPVTARSEARYVAPRQKSRQRNGTRRYNAAVTGSPRARLRIPALPQLRVGMRLASFFLVLILGGALYFAWTTPYFRVSEAQVTGSARLSPAEINAALGIANEPVFLLKPAEIVTRLRLAYPELAGAEVKVQLPNQVEVRVTERQPVIMWQQGNGFTWIDASGVAFRPRGQVDGLIQIIGLATPPGSNITTNDPLDPPPYLAPDLVKAAQLLASNVPAGATLTYDPINGLGWTDSRGWQVYFGSTSKDITLKLSVYQALVASLTARSLTPNFISVVHADAPYYRMAK